MSHYMLAVKKHGSIVKLRYWTDWVFARAIARAISTNRLVGWVGPPGCGERITKLYTTELKEHLAAV